MTRSTFLVIASLPESLIGFRRPFIEALVNAGCRVHVAAPGLSKQGDIVACLDEMQVEHHDAPVRRTGLNPLADLWTLFSLKRLISQIGADCVLGYTAKPVIYGSLAGWLLSVPQRYSLITGLGYGFIGEAEGLRKFVRYCVRNLYKVSLSKNNLVFFQNPDDERLFRDLGILKPSTPTCVVNGSGIDLVGFAQRPAPRALSFLLIARLLGDKGVREYVKAAKLLKRQYPKTGFKLAGWIDDNPDSIGRSELEEWIQSGVIDYLGKLTDVRPALSDSSVYVLPSYREGTPRTVLEAMAIGRPVITTDAPGCRETVIDGENGFLVPVKSVEGLVSAMSRFLEAPSLVDTMGPESRRIAEDKYDVNKVNARMLAAMGISCR